MRVSPLVLFGLLKEDLATSADDHSPDLSDPYRVARDFGVAPTLKHVAKVSLLASILKKFEDDVASDANDLALQKFLDGNEACRRVAPIDVEGLGPLEGHIIDEFREQMYRFFDPGDRPSIFSYAKFLRDCGFGPGASVGTTGETRYHKIGSSVLSGTSEFLYHVWKDAVRISPTWLAAEKIRRERYGGYTVVEGSKVFCVTKTRYIGRTICVEPPANMFLQKGEAHAIRSRLDEVFGINLSSQPAKNVRLARIGSRTGRVGTLDLESASNSIARVFLSEFVPPSSLRWLDHARSPRAQLPNGEWVDLHMVSSMGNDFTFPLMTAIFSCLVVATYRVLGIPVRLPRGKKRGNFAVFGDDIIVRREAYDVLCRVLDSFGFKVNREKSFNEGPFRESCGADFYNGYNVRGVYCSSLKTLHDTYSLINRLVVWSCNHDIPLPRTLRYLIGSIPKSKRLPVPPWEAVVAGLRVPLRDVTMKLTSWAHAPWICKHTGSILYKAYQAEVDGPDVSTFGDTAYDLRGRLRRVHTFEAGGKKLLHNPPALMMCAVGGFLRAGLLSLRQRDSRYKKRVRSAPGWDWLDPSASSFTRQGWHRFLSGDVLRLEEDENPVAPILLGVMSGHQRVPGDQLFNLEEISSIASEVLSRVALLARPDVAPEG